MQSVKQCRRDWLSHTWHAYKAFQHMLQLCDVGKYTVIIIVKDSDQGQKDGKSHPTLLSLHR